MADYIDTSGLKTPKAWLTAIVLLMWLVVCMLILSGLLLDALIPGWDHTAYPITNPDSPERVRAIEMQLCFGAILYTLPLWIAAILKASVSILRKQGEDRRREGRFAFKVISCLLLLWLMLTFFLVAWAFPGSPTYTPGPLQGAGVYLLAIGLGACMLLPVIPLAGLGRATQPAAGQKGNGEAAT